MIYSEQKELQQHTHIIGLPVEADYWLLDYLSINKKSQIRIIERETCGNMKLITLSLVFVVLSAIKVNSDATDYSTINSDGSYSFG